MLSCLSLHVLWICPLGLWASRCSLFGGACGKFFESSVGCLPSMYTSLGRRASVGCGSPLNSNPHRKNAQYLAAGLSGQVAARQPKPGSLPQHPLGHSIWCPVITPDDMVGPRDGGSLSLQCPLSPAPCLPLSQYRAQISNCVLSKCSWGKMPVSLVDTHKLYKPPGCGAGDHSSLRQELPILRVL